MEQFTSKMKKNCKVITLNVINMITILGVQCKTHDVASK